LQEGRGRVKATTPRAAAITDLSAGDVAEAQAALLGELPRIPDWKAGNA
jgi:hypothetical protein